MEDMKGSEQNQPKYHVNEDMVRARIENLKLEQNLGLAIIGGGVGGLLGAIIWSAVTYFTEYQIGWMAVGVGFLVGYGVSKLGKGLDKVFGIIGGAIALVSVVLGNFLASIGFLAKAFEIGYFEALLNFNYVFTLELLIETFTPMDLLFYAIAIYGGYKFSFRRISREHLLEGAILPTRQE